MNFEFPFEVVHAVHKEVWRQLEAVERGEIPHVPTQKILDILRPFVRDSLAAEYDRGYKSALDIMPANKIAKDLGYA